jgi:hypothetical protein
MRLELDTRLENVGKVRFSSFVSTRDTLTCTTSSCLTVVSTFRRELLEFRTGRGSAAGADYEAL